MLFRRRGVAVWIGQCRRRTIVLRERDYFFTMTPLGCLPRGRVGVAQIKPLERPPRGRLGVAQIKPPRRPPRGGGEWLAELILRLTTTGYLRLCNGGYTLT